MGRSVELQWVRAPHQDRSRRTMARLLDTAEGLLQERGFDTVSVAEIAAAAGSSVGAFYARFRDKNGLLQHLHERFCEEAMATADVALAPERWEDASAAEILSEVVRFMVEIHRTRSGMFRAFLLVGCTDPRFHERDQRVGEHFLGRLSELLMRRREEIGHDNPPRAIAFGMELVTGVLRDRFVLCAEAPGQAAPTAEWLVPELMRAYGNYLGLRVPAQARPSVGAIRP